MPDCIKLNCSEYVLIAKAIANIELRLRKDVNSLAIGMNLNEIKKILDERVK